MAVIKAGSSLVLMPLLILVVLTACSVSAAVLPQDRADIMYHRYEGGGVSIDGPALMLRKKASDTLALSAYYYVDTVSGASIDVVATASAYTEKRNEARFGIDYLAGDSIISINYAQSDENDYNAKSMSFGIAHDTFGGMTTLSMEAGMGDDDVSRNGDDSFKANVRRFNYKLGWSQILSSNWISAINLQLDQDEGFLNNPYRSVRYRDASQALGYGYQSEIYPATRNAVAVALVNKVYLPYRAAVTLNLRHYQDSWDIRAFDAELEYVHPLGANWILEAKARFYSQNQADFYQDLFEFKDQQNYMARDKELSEFSNLTIGLGASYQLAAWSFWPQVAPEVTLQWDHIRFDYANFRNVTVTSAEAGLEPLYQFDANVFRAFFSLYF
ncbi:DUF3570 domain-containing protein [Rheinheimera salexigens]|nr:DUF3570 domain-containing protein [Rheinheimera salexigens]